jgi:hypothetical protein
MVAKLIDCKYGIDIDDGTGGSGSLTIDDVLENFVHAI